MHSKHSAVGALVCALLLFAAPAAFAQSAEHGYAEPAGTVQQQIAGGGDPPAPRAHATRVDDSGASLPFTGFDLGLLGAGGGLLLAAGFAARRLSNSLLR